MDAVSCSACSFDNPAGFKFCGQCGAALSDSVSEAPSDNVPRVERRQLTVLFCDLVGSTALSQQFDPEDLRKVIRTYQSACEPAIEHNGGYVSRFLGDGILAFFGYPRAREDDAERAVSAGLELVGAIKAVDWAGLFGRDLHMSVRVGIATGVVVAGDLIGKGAAEEEAVIGETPNLAARLQTLAEPNTVLIAPRTKRLVGQRFDFTSLGKKELKGFAEPVSVWQVGKPIKRSTRFEAMRSANISPLVDRQQEMKYLTDRWSACKTGHSQFVIVSGEAGIGKSRITQALRDHVALEPHYYLRFQCSPYHTNTALHPVTSQFERAARIESDDNNVVKREKLTEMIRLSHVDEAAILPPVAALLSIPNAPDDPFEQLSARARKVVTINAMFDLIVGLSYSRPVLAVVEDVHWSDPTSMELIARFNKEMHNTRILTVLTRRIGDATTEEMFTEADHISLQRLKPEFSTSLVMNVAGASHLPQRLIGRIVEKADGIPLFVEELTKTLMDPDFKRANNGTFESGHESNIPDTLQDLLMARLDQLGAGKRVAQVAAIIGRQFNFELLERVVDITRTALFDGLEQLANSGLIFANGVAPKSQYSFKHALVRDTAYSSLLREERRGFHEKIAAVMEADRLPKSPELLARHYTEAGLHRQAIDYWLLAGQQSSQQSALNEAVDQFQNGLALLHAQPYAQARNQKLLEYLINLGPAMIATRGAGEAETEAVYREAVTLSDSLPESGDHFTAHWGWWRISKNFKTKAERAEKLQQLAERLGDEGLKLQAHHCQWPTRFHLGDHEGSQQHIDDGMKLYADRDYRSHAARYGGHDPRSCALGNAAQLLWLTGFPEKAVEFMRRARIWAEELQQTGSMVNVMDCNLLLLRYRRDPIEAGRCADELMIFANENQFPEYKAKALVFKGWSLAKTDSLSEGLDMMREGIATHVGIGTNEDPPVWLEMLADGYMDNGEYRAGLDTLKEAFQHTERSGLQFWLAELHRRRGELLHRLGEPYIAESRESLERALEISAKQGARSLELRAAASLLQHAQHHGEERSARERLEHIMSLFDEGFNTPDFLEARALLVSMADSAHH